MALVRILVDGYSLLHNWPQLAPGHPRHSAAARDELIHVLTRYQDAIHTAVTIVFDGGGAPADTPRPDSTPEMEVIYSGAGQTADDIIERVAFRIRDFGEALVVTDDFAERDTVLALDGLASSCLNFIHEVEKVLQQQERDITQRNRRESARFKEAKSAK
ncbi:MAG: NYN domain-containing protein [Verrucomicrobiota bacterium]|jgi:predicted RNA-binding protein with PIN domain